jgi:hypothetical protein
MFLFCSSTGKTKRSSSKKQRSARMTKKDNTSPTASPTLTIDWEFYARFLEETDASDIEKQELLEALWSVVCTFVDLGFGIEPVQQAIESRKLEQLIADRRRIAAPASSSSTIKGAKEIAKKGRVQ